MKTELTNAAIAELLAREAEQQKGIRKRAFKKAARSVFLWPEHACDLLSAGRSLTELKGIGPFNAGVLRRWLEQPAAKILPPPLRRDFLALADARDILAHHPAWTKALRGDLQMHTHWIAGQRAALPRAESTRPKADCYRRHDRPNRRRGVEFKNKERALNPATFQERRIIVRTLS